MLLSDIEEHRLTLTLKPDVEDPFVGALPRQQRLSSPLGDEGEHGVGFERRVACKVDSRVDLTEETSGEKADLDVRCLRLALRITLRPR